ncbi:cytochrome d ubiquinol oxidase subunit II [Schlesneria paludicola]|uniref:cytochrome d ubiquinol oxidase subunit II n=1 Tax=Schlesneria paludicola TaxID=360056 RepID=UPI00029AB782|nr:cytochrome d ubiquinol oxidase subunit II [Schlesneria paludicola]
MEAVWFVIIAAMLAIYAVLDGFDFGVGIMHHFVARNDEERRIVLAAIGPIWDGNEVWLIAAGGALFMAFPLTYSTAFSGFYLALMIVLWLLILRGLAIAFRSHQENLVWRQFWDAVFSCASIALAVVFGATLGNLVRGVPLDADGLNAMPLFTSFMPGPQPGVFDCYTVLVGLFTLVALAGHGALFLVWRTSGPVHARSQTYAAAIWRCIVVLWALVTLATLWVQRDLFITLVNRPWSVLFVSLAIGGIWGVFHFMNSKRELAAFASSSAFLLGLIAATMIGNFPFWLRSTIDSSFGLTAYNTASSSSSLRTALSWWLVGIILIAGYFTVLFRSIREKVDARELGNPH